MSRLPKQLADLSPAERELLAQRLRKQSGATRRARAITRRTDAASAAPLSFAQQRLWVIDQLESGTFAYNLPTVVRFKGRLNVKALEAALNQIIRRHEILRTVFTTADGRPAQAVVPVAPLSIPILSLSGIPESKQMSETLRLAREELERPFDLARWPLLRIKLLQLAEEDNVALLTIHHIISDAWSFDIFVEELGLLYKASLDGSPSPLPELPIQYGDFAAWQRERLQGEVLRSEISHWKRRFEGELAMLELPTDYPRPPVRSYRGARVTRHFAKSLLDSLKSLSSREGVTLFMTLLAAFKVLLYRYTGQQDIIIGSPIANRNKREVEGLIGFFVNTLALRTSLSGNPSFRELLKRVSKTCVEAYAHQDMPFEKLIEELQLERELNRAPLFQVMFNLQNISERSLELPGVSLSFMNIQAAAARFDLTVELSETPDHLSCSFIYSTDLFEAATADRMAGHFQRLLECLAANPDLHLSEVSVLTQSERHQLLVEWNDTDTDYSKENLLHRLFEAQAERSPSAVALIFRDQQATFLELNALANKLAHHLRRLGVGPDQLVAICAERSVEMVIGIIGILKAGAAYVPLDPAYPKERLAFMLEDTRAQIILTQRHLIEALPDNGARVICLDTDWGDIDQESDSNLEIELRPDNLAYVIYTSGSTGKPKGVMVAHGGICNRVLWVKELIQPTKEDRLLQKTPFSFDASVWEFFLPLASATPLIMAEPGGHQDTTYLAETIAAYNITTVQLVPTMLQMLLDEPGITECVSLRRVFCGGEALPVKLQERFLARLDSALFNTYGPTEASIDVSFTRCEAKHDRQIISIGRPISNMKVYLLGSNLQPVPVGVPAELYISGIGLARGYLNRPELTAEKFIPDPFSPDPGSRLYKTGDLARYMVDGEIEFLGRVDEQVKIRGFRIELGEVEATLRLHPAVEDALVVVREDAPGDKRLVCYLIFNQDESLTISDLRSFLEKRLPDYMVPASFVTLDSWPSTPNGKLDRRALPPPDQGRPELKQSYVAPTGSTEEALAAIWEEVLGLKQVGIHDNFFELGGDSILSIQVVSRANRAGIRLSPKQFFQHQTIAGLATVANKIETAQAEQGLVIGSSPLTPIQCWFFDHDFAEPHHWNQAVLLELRRDLNAGLLRKVIEQMLTHHDALRSRFALRESKWYQVGASSDPHVPFTESDLSELAQEQQAAAIEQAATRLQMSLNLSEGPLVRSALFHLGDDRPGRLLVIIHHLIVDGVSWRILLEDLQTAYQQLARGEQIELPAKTVSFKRWAEIQKEHAQSEVLRQELDYWARELNREFAPVPLDYPENGDTEPSERIVSSSLSSEETRSLLQEAPKAYRTQVNDILLTAMALTLSRWTAQSSILIDVEGHGREAVRDDLDVSRTVGWFTSIFPVALNLPQTENVLEALKSVKEQLRGIPGRGIGYGLLRYLKDDRQGVDRIRYGKKAEVLFNYLGQFDNILSESALFKIAPESSGPSRSRRSSLPYLIQVNAGVDRGQLRLDWSYNEKVYSRSTIERLADSFLGGLRSLIIHCLSPDAGGYTPSDFPESELIQEDLDKLLTRLSKSQSLGIE